MVSISFFVSWNVRAGALLEDRALVVDVIDVPFGTDLKTYEILTQPLTAEMRPKHGSQIGDQRIVWLKW